MAEELRLLEEQEQQGMALGEALLKVQEGLVNGRKWLWDEAARKLGTLLSSPAAFEGEHFLQVEAALCLNYISKLMHATQIHTRLTSN